MQVRAVGVSLLIRLRPSETAVGSFFCFLRRFLFLCHKMIVKPSFELKLDRARQHLEELRVEIERWRKTRPYRLADEFDATTGDNIIYGQLARPLPSLIPELIGDCLQNLRSSLDHLAYALAIANKGSLTDAEAIQTEFPIFRCRKGFETRGKSKMRNLGNEAQAIIRRLQPCNSENPASHRLWLLQRLNNIDKHRRLLVSAVSLMGGGVHQPCGAQMVTPFTWQGDGVFRETKTELARYQCIDPKTSNRVKVEFRPTLITVFGDIPAEDCIVQVLLEGIEQCITALVIPRFKRFL